MSRNVTDLGRAKYQNPEIFFDVLDGGTDLYDRLTAMHRQSSDNATARFTGSVTLATTATHTVTHNFGLTGVGELEVLIWESGTLISKTKIATAAGTGVEYVIAATNSNVLTIQNVSAGSKTFFALVFAHRFLTAEVAEALSMIILSDTATTGSNVTLPAATRPITRLSNASLASVSMIPAGLQGQPLKLINAKASGSIVVNNESGATAANRILTGTGSAITLQAGACLDLLYDSVSSRWRIVGGTGGGGATVDSAVRTVASGGTIPIGTQGVQVIRVQGTSGVTTASTTPFGTTPPPDGTRIILVGESPSNPVLIPHNTGANGVLLGGECTLSDADTLEVVYIANRSQYIETSRSIKFL